MSRAKSGRKRKEGKRYKSGRLMRTPARDLGTPETQARRARYTGPATDGRDVAAQTVDALGRAWCAGLLGIDGYDGQALRDAGRQFAMLYWRKLPAPNPVSSIYRNMVSGLVEELPAGMSRAAAMDSADERDRRQEAALLRILDMLDACGGDVRRAFDQLVLEPFSDSGPRWLDALIEAKRTFDRRFAKELAEDKMREIDWPANVADVRREVGLLRLALIGLGTLL